MQPRSATMRLIGEHQESPSGLPTERGDATVVAEPFGDVGSIGCQPSLP